MLNVIKEITKSTWKHQIKREKQHTKTRTHSS